MNPNKLLHTALWINGSFSILTALAAVITDAHILAIHDLTMGYPAVFALQMIPFGAFVLYHAARKKIARRMIYAIIVLDVLWVAMIIGRVMLEPALSESGRLLMMSLAVIVAGFALAQYLGIRGIPRSISPSVIVLLLVSSLLSGCSLYDLRKHVDTELQIDAVAEAKGRELIQACAAAHGWTGLGPTQFDVVFTDTWKSGLIRAFFHPWPTHEAPIRHTYSNQNLYSSEVSFLEGIRKHEKWGLENQQAYVIQAGEKKLRKHANTSFYLPTFQYFVQMPHWIQEIPILVYAGERLLNGEMYDLVFGSWNSLEPQADIDQYLFWLERETHYLKYVEYTVRGQFKSAHGVNSFSNFRDVDGLVIPFQQTVSSLPDSEKGFVHRLTLHAFLFEEDLQFFP